MCLDGGKGGEEESYASFVVVSDEPDGLHEFGEFFDAAGFCLGLVYREDKIRIEIRFLRAGGGTCPW